MNPNIIIVDLQGFKDKNNRFIVKEFALSGQKYTQTFLIKPPYAFKTLSPEEKKQVIWLEKRRGIYWSEGYVDYREFKRIIIQYLRKKIIWTKGGEKTLWIKELCSDCEIIDLAEKGVQTVP